MPRLWTCAAVLLLGVPVAASAQTLLELPALIEQMEERNPVVLAAIAEADAADLAATYAAPFPDPMVGLSVNPLPVYTARGVQRSVLRFEQPLPRRGERAAIRAVLGASGSAARYEAAALVADAKRDLRIAYYSLAAVHAKSAILRDFSAELQDFEEAAALQYETGQGPQQALLKAQIEKNRTRRDLIGLESAEHGLRSRIVRLIAAPLAGDAWAELPNTLPSPVFPSAPNVASDPLTMKRLAMSERFAALARQARSSLNPAIAVHATWIDIAESSIPSTSDGRDAFGVGVSVRLPLARDTRRAEIERNKILEAVARLQADDRETEINAELGASSGKILDGIRAIALIRKTLIPQAETALQATLNAYTNGGTDFLDLLDAERTLVALRLDEIETHRSILEEAARYERLSGYALPSQPIDG